MESRIHQMMWGSQAESKSAREWNQQDPLQILSQRIQQALSDEQPTPQVSAIRVSKEKRYVNGRPRKGYCITVALTVEYAPGSPPDSPEETRVRECRIESLLSVALLELLTPVHVDFVATLHEA